MCSKIQNACQTQFSACIGHANAFASIIPSRIGTVGQCNQLPVFPMRRAISRMYIVPYMFMNIRINVRTIRTHACCTKSHVAMPRAGCEHFTKFPRCQHEANFKYIISLHSISIDSSLFGGEMLALICAYLFVCVCAYVD